VWVNEARILSLLDLQTITLSYTSTLFRQTYARKN
jgi:hypothetical protein